MPASDEETHPLVRFFKRSLVQYNSFSDSSSTDQRPPISIRKIQYSSDKVREKDYPELLRVLEEQEIIEKIFSQRSANAAPSLDEILSSVGYLLIVGGAFVCLHQMFKFVNSQEAKRKAKISRARARRGSSSSNGCLRCGDSGKKEDDH